MTQALSSATAREIWPDYRPTPLLDLPRLAARVGVAQVVVKVEGARPLGNFKSLGGMVAGLRALARAAGVARFADLRGRPDLPRLICASDGNHGLAVAAAARRVATPASVFLPRSVGPGRASRIIAMGGEVVWVEGSYDEAVEAAAAAAARGEGLLIPDTAPDSGDPVVADVMAGYGLLMEELARQLPAPPTHAFIQAGVGGLAAAVANALPDGVALAVVEPEAAACVAAALAAGRPELLGGELHTSAEMLSCGLASAVALPVLLRRGARSVLVSEAGLLAAPALLAADGGPATTPSGAAGLAGLLDAAAAPESRLRHGLGPQSRILLIATEGPGPT